MPVVKSQIRTDLEQLYAAIDADEFDSAVQFLSEDVDWIWGGVPQSSRAKVAAFLGKSGRSLEGRKHTITAYVEGDGSAAAELAVAAVHSGSLYLPTGPIRATGKNLNISACHFLRTDPDGRFAVSHIYVDFVGLLAQLSPAAG
jgi:ketosteroid isomerase-like protein